MHHTYARPYSHNNRNPSWIPWLLSRDGSCGFYPSGDRLPSILMLCTIKEDAMGSLHIWEGRVKPVGYKYTWTVRGKWAGLYVQNPETAQDIISNLTPKQKDQLAHGWEVVANISSLYFSKY